MESQTPNPLTLPELVSIVWEALNDYPHVESRLEDYDISWDISNPIHVTSESGKRFLVTITEEEG